MQTRTVHTSLTVPQQDITKAIFDQAFDHRFTKVMTMKLVEELIKDKLIAPEIVERQRDPHLTEIRLSLTVVTQS